MVLERQGENQVRYCGDKNPCTIKSVFFTFSPDNLRLFRETSKRSNSTSILNGAFAHQVESVFEFSTVESREN